MCRPKISSRFDIKKILTHIIVTNQHLYGIKFQNSKRERFGQDNWCHKTKVLVKRYLITFPKSYTRKRRTGLKVPGTFKNRIFPTLSCPHPLIPDKSKQKSGLIVVKIFPKSHVFRFCMSLTTSPPTTNIQLNGTQESESERKTSLYHFFHAFTNSRSAKNGI